MTLLASEVGRAVPRTASRTARTKLGSTGQSLPARSAVVVQSRTRPSPDDPLDHRGRPARVVPAGEHADRPPLAPLVHRHDLAGRDPLQRGGLQLQQALDRRRADGLDDQAPDVLVDQGLQRERQEPVVRAEEQVVVEAGVELRPGEDHQAHPVADEAVQPVGLLGRRRRDVGHHEHVGGIEPRGEEVVLQDDLDAPGLGRADPDGQGGGEVVDLGAERFRRRLAVHQADQQRVLHRDGGPAAVVARQLVVGELEREVVRPGPRELDGQRDPGGLPGRDLRQGHLGRLVVDAEDRLGAGEHARRAVADHGLPATLGAGEDRPVERDQRLQGDVADLVGADVHDPDPDPLLAPAAGRPWRRPHPTRTSAGR